MTTPTLTRATTSALLRVASCARTGAAAATCNDVGCTSARRSRLPFAHVEPPPRSRLPSAYVDVAGGAVSSHASSTPTPPRGRWAWEHRGPSMGKSSAVLALWSRPPDALPRHRRRQLHTSSESNGDGSERDAQRKGQRGTAEDGAQGTESGIASESEPAVGNTPASGATADGQLDGVGHTPTTTPADALPFQDTPPPPSSSPASSVAQDGRSDQPRFPAGSSQAPRGSNSASASSSSQHVAALLAQRLAPLRAWTEARLGATRQAAWATLQRLGLQYNHVSGYEQVEKLKRDVAETEQRLAQLRVAHSSARQAYQDAVARRSSTQRALNELLTRKPPSGGWSTEADLSRYTQLLRSEHAEQLDETRASREQEEAEKRLGEVWDELVRRTLERYHEEWRWSERGRSLSAWVSAGVVGLNVLVFLVAIFVVEPYKRRRLAETLEQRMLKGEARSSARLTAALGAIDAAPTGESGVAAAAAAAAAQLDAPEGQATRTRQNATDEPASAASLESMRSALAKVEQRLDDVLSRLVDLASSEGLGSARGAHPSSAGGGGPTQLTGKANAEERGEDKPGQDAVVAGGPTTTNTTSKPALAGSPSSSASSSSSSSSSTARQKELALAAGVGFAFGAGLLALLGAGWGAG